jgi:hypothetical protein
LQLFDESLPNLKKLIRVNAAATSQLRTAYRGAHPRCRCRIGHLGYRHGDATHVRLAGMYEADSRFAEDIDWHVANLTFYLAAVIRSNPERTLTDAPFQFDIRCSTQ